VEIRYISDIHSEMFLRNMISVEEFLEEALPVTEIDRERVLVMAGDMFRIDAPFLHCYAVEVLNYVSKAFKYVVYVPGNHEYYGSSIEDCNRDLKHLFQQYPNVKNLEEYNILTIGTTSFVGGAMWSDVQVKGPKVEALVRRSLSDYTWIRDFTTKACTEIHKKCVEKIFKTKKFIGMYENSKLVVVTHHLPSYESVHEDYISSGVNPAFVTELREQILSLQPAVWIHGHTHKSCNYHIGKTNVVSNPFGYDWNENPDFSKEAVIKLN